MKLDPATTGNGRAEDPAAVEVLGALRSHRQFVMCAHENPDCDVLASGFALGIALKRLGKEVTYFLDDDVPRNLTFLPESALTQRTFDGVGDDALFVFFDMSDQSRAGKALNWVPSQRIINVDHHLSNTRFGRWNYVRDTEAATGVLVLQLVVGLDTEITGDIAECLLSAIMSDTGCFMYSNANSRTLRIAAALIDAGADKDRIAEQLYQMRTFAAQKILGRTLDAAVLTDDGICYSVVTQPMLADIGADNEDLEEVVGALRAVDRCQVAALLKEQPDGSFRLSLRSRGRVNVMAIAKSLGGGGHFRAAGAPVVGPAPAALERVLSAIRAQIAAQ
ncbi:MAG: bifunctional oligoribonuclease/PAP phosphatase NrnA [Candidatus Eremiobacteraeota bacterium]|nr:bifunctional oligoribonuclease/PAP phosphatase NrnA [Candidatus Eremiobacteraeota bacterium]MBV8365610.1 bifunctional oligoribonuclease/PAP phosphatase NrnA [Candidatus Eremiobacteraeota bacterium]